MRDASASGQWSAGNTPTLTDGPLGVRWNAKVIVGKFGGIPIARTQSAYRWRDDDADEDEAAWLELQDIPTNIDKNTTLRIRIQVDTSEDVASAQYQLEWQRVGGAGWQKVN